MLIIGLTGGIGSGKSTVAELFAALGVPVIDSDLIAKAVLTTQKILLDKVIAHFGLEILDPKGQLNRSKLREIIFADAKQQAWLEQLLHPSIIEEIKQQVSQLRVQHVPYCIVVIPLLTEVPEARQLVDRVLVVDVPEETQIIRTGQRDKLALEAVKNILASQAGREQRLSTADDIIHNEKDIEALRQQVQQLHQQYITGAS